jgi:hypothetical protein
MRAGRHRHQPTAEQRRQVMTLAGLGITQDQIASLLRLAPKTLRLRYRQELDTGATEANVRVAQSLFNLATKEGNVAAQIFWLKARAGWREKQDVTINGTQTIQMQHLVAARAMSEQLHGQLIEAAPEPSEDEPEEPPIHPTFLQPKADEPPGEP